MLKQSQGPAKYAKIFDLVKKRRTRCEREVYRGTAVNLTEA